MTPIEILQLQHITRRFRPGVPAYFSRRDFTPEATHTQSQRQHRKAEYEAEHQGQGVVRKDGVEVAGQRGMYHAAGNLHRQHQK